MNNIVLVGTGGAGVSAVARLFLSCGCDNIVGIDSTEGEITKQLIQEGMQVIIGHGNYQVHPDDFVIYSSATEQSSEVQEAFRLFEKRESIRPPFSYFEFLGEISKLFTTIAVAGTHGKSTTTALSAAALAAHHPDFGLGIVGAGLADRGGKNMNINQSHSADISAILSFIVDPKAKNVEHLAKKYLFIIEACEYNYQFLSLDVDIAAITNIELDHADVYGTFENYLDTFVQFCKKTKKQIITLSNTQGMEVIAQNITIPVQEIDIQQFDFKHLLGSHNHANASLALQLCTYLDPDKVSHYKNTIQSFSGLRRRGELLQTNDHGVPILTDYAHHPTELNSTLEALREKYSDQHITLIFQPHQARRVVEFWDEFIQILRTTIDPIIYSIYTAREEVSHIAGYNIQSQYLQDEVGDIQSFTDLGNLFVNQFNGKYVTDVETIQKMLTDTTSGVILICTAGDLDWEVRQFLGITK